jgi:DNA polymerase-3 subunit delta'
MPAMLPWQNDVMRRALMLKRDQHLPHAVLLESPSDAHMDQLARYLPTLLLCDNPRELSLCAACEACRMMAAGTYADFSLVTVEPDQKTKKMSKNIKIEQIRDLIHELSLTRKYNRLKLAVIYPAESMSSAGANALLKTLEEPAPGVLLLLLTRYPGRIPVTLRSRCQAWSINPPDEGASLEWLEHQGITGQTAIQYLQYAGGDPLLAQQLQQQEFAQRVDGFKTRFAAFMRGALSVSELGSHLLANENAIARRLIAMTLRAYCFQACGVDGNAQGRTDENRARARDLLDLQRRAQQQLQVEENNLDFQLQLEDVLISLKQILTRRLN